MLKVLRYVFELFELTLPFSLSTGHGFLSDLPDKAFFELEEAPFLAECLITSIQANQKEIRQHGQHDRASHTLAFLRDLHLPGYPRKAGHLMTSTTERHDRLAVPRSGQILDIR